VANQNFKVKNGLEVGTGVTISSGIVTATTFSGNFSGNATSSTYATTAGIATYATSSGISTYATTAGIATYATSSGISTYATTAGIATYALTAGVSTNVIGGIGSITQLQVSGVTTFQNNVYLGDNDFIYFGDSSDLYIGHNGSVSAIADSGTGDLYIAGDNSLIVTDLSYAENKAKFNTNGSVELYFDNSKKFETTGYGATVYGTLSVNDNIGIGVTNPQTKLQISGVLGFGATNNIRIGDSTTGPVITSGTSNIFIGPYAGAVNSSGATNIFLGLYAGFNNQTGSNNVFLGQQSGYFNTASSNSFIGFSAGQNNSSGGSNSFFGVAAGVSNQTGSNNVFIGARNGISASASYKVIIGSGYLANYFDSPDTTKSNQFAVGIRTDANNSKYWLVGNENFNIGIGSTNPTSKLHVVGNVNISGVSTATTVNDSSGNVRAVPQNAQTSAYILAASDVGKHISITTGGVTVNSGIFSVGDTLSIYNNSASNQTITQGTSVTMYLVGTATTGNRTLAQRGVATILCVASNTFVIMGGGLT
jgi:hypothetical protein